MTCLPCHRFRCTWTSLPIMENPPVVPKKLSCKRTGGHILQDSNWNSDRCDRGRHRRSFPSGHAKILPSRCLGRASSMKDSIRFPTRSAQSLFQHTMCRAWPDGGPWAAMWRTEVFCQSAIEGAQNDHASKVHAILANKEPWLIDVGSPEVGNPHSRRFNRHLPRLGFSRSRSAIVTLPTIGSSRSTWGGAEGLVVAALGLNRSMCKRKDWHERSLKSSRDWGP